MTRIEGRPVVHMRVAMVGPPLESSGGIGRLMSYALQCLPEGVRVEVIDSRGFGSAPSSLLVALRAAFLLAALRFSRKIDVVHINMSSHGSFVRKAILLLVSRALGLPAIVQLHASSFDEFYEGLPFVARLAVRLPLRLASRFLVLGERWFEFATTRLRLNPERVLIVRCGVPAAISAPRVRSETDVFQLCFLGRLGKRKGIPTLLEALECLARTTDLKWRVVLAGDGPVEFYQAEIRRRGLADRVQLTGWIDQGEAAALLNSSDALVLPSFAEGLPVSVLEAMAHGIPVVCTAVGALPDLGGEASGLVTVRPGDPAELCAALEALVRDRALAKRLGDAALYAWQRDFSVEHTTRLLTEIWCSTRAGSSDKRGGGALRLAAGPDWGADHA